MKFLRFLKAFRPDAAKMPLQGQPTRVAVVLGLGQAIMTVIGSGVTGLGDAIVVEGRNHRAT